ncbi:MAG: tetratricopeptide repeat protein [Planctomycetota bacterium]
MLDAFVERMLRVYALERKRLTQRAPFRIRAFRSREDFKRLQEEKAPEMARLKGEAFAKGVTGFYSPAARCIFLWDAEGARGDPHPGTALHETTHLLNHLLREATGARMPVWFDEGTACYFETWLPGAREPEVNFARLAVVVDDIEAGRTYTNRALRGVGWAEYRSREYAWGWSFIDFLRRRKRRKSWNALVEYLGAIGRGAAVEAEERRFLEALSYRDSESIDRDWVRHIEASKSPGGRTPLGASDASLESVAKIEEPTPEQGALFAKIGRSFARAGLPKPAVVYLRAAVRGGVATGSLLGVLARALARAAGRAEDEVWPREAVEVLERAVAADPLSASLRLVLGMQQLVRAGSTAQSEEARDTLGLALMLLGPTDDDKAIARWALEAGVDARPASLPREVLGWWKTQVPEAAAALDAAWVIYLQERQAWEDLIEELERRSTRGTASFEDRTTLAGLYLASDRFDDAAALYARLLEERPEALHLWPSRLRALVGAGRLDEARAARDAALKAIDAGPQGFRQALHRLVERIVLR